MSVVALAADLHAEPLAAARQCHHCGALVAGDLASAEAQVFC